jgi:hypothetical protein
MFYVIENRTNGIRIITHCPRRDERVLRVCQTADAAFAELRTQERDQKRRRMRRDGIIGLALLALFISAAALVPDLPAPTQIVEVRA